MQFWKWARGPGLGPGFRVSFSPRSEFTFSLVQLYCIMYRYGVRARMRCGTLEYAVYVATADGIAT